MSMMSSIFKENGDHHQTAAETALGISTTSSNKDSTIITARNNTICLPSEDYVVQSWKITSGSPVRAGDKVAVAVRRTNEDFLLSSNSSTTTATADNSSPTSAAAATGTISLKRPKKRRRPGAAAIHLETAPDGPPHENANTLPRQDSVPHDEPPTTSNKTRLFPQQHPHHDAITLIAPADGLLRIVPDEKRSGDVIVGYVEPCQHPQILMGMCTVCGVAIAATFQSESSINNSNNTVYGSNGNRRFLPDMTTTTSNGNNNGGGDSNTTFNRSNVTVSGGITMMVSEEEGQQIAQQTAQRLLKQKKLSLVLDLDHTLVHATYDARARAHLLRRDDVRTVVLPIFENITHPSQRQAWTWHYIKLRPHVKEFLESVMPMYEIGVYTAGTRQYAEQITMILSRHVVGATMDQPELEGLRHRVAQMERELLQHNAASRDDSTPQQDAPEEDSKMPAKTNQQANGVAAVDEVHDNAEISANVDDTTNDATVISIAQNKVENGPEDNQRNEPPSRTRKHVTFNPLENVGEAAANPDAQDQFENIEHDDIDGVAHAVGPAVAEHDEEDDDMTHRKRVRFGEPGQNSWYNNANDQGPLDDDSDAARGGCKPRKRVSFGEPPESNRSDQVNPVLLEELRQQLAEAERLELAASKLRQQLFGSRIVSRTDVTDLGKDVKSLRRIFPCGGSMAVVVDDREDVWANALDNASGRKGEPPENLLMVRPYHWKPFLGFADVNNAAGTDLSASSSSTASSSSSADAQDCNAAGSEDADHQLLWTRDILQRLHHKYFHTKKASDYQDVATILRSMRGKVLKHTKLVLSALVPLRKQNRSASLTSPRPPVIRIAESLGAKVCENTELVWNDLIKKRRSLFVARSANTIFICSFLRWWILWMRP
jgi:TFIIF-interacting CTD phosphatase-like protein